jgi:hypothetical protein
MRNLILLLLFYTFLVNSIISQDLIPYNKNGKWGYADKNMNVIIPCTYNYAMPFYEDRALVKVYDDSSYLSREYFIDKEGKIIFGTFSTSSSDFSATRFQHGLTLIENYNGAENSVSLVDKYGKALKRIERASLQYELGTKGYSNSFNNLGFYVTNNYSGSNHCTFVYKDGSTKKLDSINVDKFNGKYATASFNQRSFLIDSSGKKIVSTDKYDIISYSEDLLRVTNIEQQHGFLNLKGNVVIKPELEFADDFSEGLAVFGEKDPKGNEYKLLYGYMNKKGKIVLPAIYDKAYNFSDELADVVIGDSLFFIDKKGNKILRFRSKFNSDYNSFGDMFEYTHGFKNGIAIIIQNNKFAWIDKKGNYVIPPLYIGSNLGSPVNTVYDFDGAVTLINLPNQTECYIDEEGIPYYEKPYSILCKNVHSKQFTSMQPDSIKNEPLENYNRLTYVKSFTDKYFKSTDPETEFIQIEDSYTKGYVSAEDYYTVCYSIRAKKGAKIYRDEKTETVLDYLPFRFQLHSEKEIPNFNQLSDDTRVALIYYDSFYFTDEKGYQTVYIRKGDIEKMVKPRVNK